MSKYYNENPQVTMWREKYEVLEKEYQCLTKENNVLRSQCDELKTKLEHETARADSNYHMSRRLVKKKIDIQEVWETIRKKCKC